MSRARFEGDQLPSAPWKNGGGRTREIIRMPPGSDMETFEWRASIADISADGPFSTFAGIDRAIMLLSGDGVQLRSHDGKVDHRLDEPLAPFTFAGESDIAASLIGSASSDFNVMTRRGVVRADLRTVRGSETLAECPDGVLFAARGKWKIRAATPNEQFGYSLPENVGVWWNNELLSWKLEPRNSPCAIIAARVVRYL